MITVHGHFIDLCRVIEFNVTEDTDVFASDKVDSDTLPTETTATTDTVDVVFTVSREVIVDDQGHLLHVDTTGPDVRGDQDARVPLPEVLHDAIPLLLGHLTVHAGNGEVGLAHLVSEPVDLAAGVAEDDCLGDGEGVVEVAEGVEFPFFLLHGDEILLDAFEGQLVTLHQHAYGVCHELGCHVEDIVGEGSGDHHDLCGGWEVAVDIVNLLAESAVEKFISFIEDQHLDVPGAQVAPPDHICDSAWCTRHNVLAVIQLADVFTDICTSNTSMALHVHVVTEGHHDGLDLSCKFASRGKDKSCQRSATTRTSIYQTHVAYLDSLEQQYQ